MKLRTRRRIIKRRKTTKIYKQTSIRKQITQKILSLPFVQDVLRFIEDSKRNGITFRLRKIVFLPNKGKEND